MERVVSQPSQYVTTNDNARYVLEMINATYDKCMRVVSRI